MKNVDYLIIGAGLAGMVVHQFLQNPNVVIVDPRPGGYKIGESIIPEHFHHPVMKELLPAIQKLPSYSPKHGTTFIRDDRVASFPLPEQEIGQAMHVSRHEMEALMLETWETPVVEERVIAVDFEQKVVTTDTSQYRVAQQIIDCSGPAMVLAQLLGEVEELWPVYATWAYYDIVENDAAGFEEAIEERGWTKVRYDSRNRVLLRDEELAGWEAGRTTILTHVSDGVWTWQIPLHSEQLLSFGVVSRHGKISQEQLDELAAQPAPNYKLKPRPLDKSSDHNRLHVRNHFARRASTPATDAYILVSDAYAFADPIYSVGTGFAVNKAIEVATILNETGWTPETKAAYCANYESQIERAVGAFQFWYSGEVVSEDSVAAEVRDKYLVGEAFQTDLAQYYGSALADADLSDRVLNADPFSIDWNLPSLEGPVCKLLPLKDGRLAGWQFVGANLSAGGVVARWTHDEWPDLFLLVASEGADRALDFRVSYRNLMESDYPMSDALRGLIAALTESTCQHSEEWLAIASERARA